MGNPARGVEIPVLLVASVFMLLKPDVNAGLMPGPLGTYAAFTLYLLGTRIDSVTIQWRHLLTSFCTFNLLSIIYHNWPFSIWTIDCFCPGFIG